MQVIHELSSYEAVCKNAKEALKHSILVREKELTRKQHLDQIRQRTGHRNSSTTDAELTRSKTDLTKSTREMEDVIRNFELQKLQDTKRILLDFMAIQLKQHVKAVEILSATYQDIIDIDEEKDLEVSSFSERSERS